MSNNLFYTIKLRSIVDFGEQIIPSVNSTTVRGGDEYFDRMEKQELLDKTPVFDYFSLQTTHWTEPEKWEWMVQDAHSYIGGYMPIGWFVSDHFKEILEQFIIAEPYRFYPAKLKFRNQKLDYYVFNLLSRKLETLFVLEDLKYIMSDPVTGEKKGMYPGSFPQKDSVVAVKINVRKEQGLDMLLHTVRVRKYFDFLPLFGLNADIIISERLKRAIEQSKVEGVIINSAPYTVIMPDNIPSISS